MPSAREPRARRATLPSTLWVLGAVASSCVYPELSTSPSWRDEALAGAGIGGTSGSSGEGGRPSNAGGNNEAGDAPGPAPVGGGGEGGAAGPDIIHATVVDQNGEPIAGVPLLIDELELATDANGQAATPGEDRASFRATVIGTESKVVYVYEGLTRRQLHFVLPRFDAPDLDTGMLTGTVTTPVPEQNLQVAFVDPARAFRSFGTLNFTDVAPNVRYEISPSWSGGTLSGTVQGINWSIGPGWSVPNAFYFGSKTASLTPNGTVQRLDFPLSELDTRELTVTISAPAGTTRNDFLLLGPFTVVNLSAASATLTYVIPDDEDFDDSGAVMQFLTTCTFGAAGAATSNIFMPLGAARDSINETCPAPPELTSPADQATGVKRTTPLVFVPAQTGCNAVNVAHLATSWNITVFTLASQVVLPDLSAWGVDYTAHDVDWTASTSSPCDSIDAYVLPPTGQPLPDDAPASTFSRSDHRTFTTAP